MEVEKMAGVSYLGIVSVSALIGGESVGLRIFKAPAVKNLDAVSYSLRFYGLGFALSLAL